MKAEHRKELERNVLRERVSQVADTLKQKPTSGVYVAVGVLLFGIAGYGIWKYLSVSTAKRASERWTKLDEIRNVKDLPPFVEQNAGTPAARTARFEEARYRLQQGVENLGSPTQHDSAIQNLETARSQYEELVPLSRDVPVLVQEAMMGRAKAEGVAVGHAQAGQPGRDARQPGARGRAVHPAQGRLSRQLPGQGGGGTHQGNPGQEGQGAGLLCRAEQAGDEEVGTFTFSASRERERPEDSGRSRSRLAIGLARVSLSRKRQAVHGALANSFAFGREGRRPVSQAQGRKGCASTSTWSSMFPDYSRSVVQKVIDAGGVTRQRQAGQGELQGPPRRPDPHLAAGADARPARPRGHSARHPLRGRVPGRHQQAGRHGRASGQGPLERHAGQRPAVPLRPAQPAQRRLPARHRPPPRPRHQRRHPRGQGRADAPRPEPASSRRARSSRNTWPSRPGVLDRDSDYIEGRIGHHPHDRVKMAVTDDEDEDGKEACSYYEVIERFRGFTLLPHPAAHRPDAPDSRPPGQRRLSGAGRQDLQRPRLPAAVGPGGRTWTRAATRC